MVKNSLFENQHPFFSFKIGYGFGVNSRGIKFGGGMNRIHPSAADMELFAKTEAEEEVLVGSEALPALASLRPLLLLLA